MNYLEAITLIIGLAMWFGLLGYIVYLGSKSGFERDFPKYKQPKMPQWKSKGYK